MCTQKDPLPPSELGRREIVGVGDSEDVVPQSAHDGDIKPAEVHGRGTLRSTSGQAQCSTWNQGGISVTQSSSTWRERRQQKSGQHLSQALLFVLRL